MTTTSIISVLAPTFAGLGVMAYRHHEWFMPFSQALLYGLILFCGGMLGFEIAVATVIRKIPENGHDILRKDIIELGADVDSSLAIYCLIGIVVLRQVSEHVYVKKQCEPKNSGNS